MAGTKFSWFARNNGRAREKQTGARIFGTLKRNFPGMCFSYSCVGKSAFAWIFFSVLLKLLFRSKRRSKKCLSLELSSWKPKKDVKFRIKDGEFAGEPNKFALSLSLHFHLRFWREIFVSRLALWDTFSLVFKISTFLSWWFDVLT